MNFNKQYMTWAALGGFIGFFVGTQAFMPVRQSIWLVLFGGTAGYAIAESRGLRKLDSGAKSNISESEVVAELRGLLAELKRDKPVDSESDRPT